MIYYTSDLHLGNNNIIAHENRPWETVEEMDKALIANWNSRVTPEDDVYVLGDFCFKGATKAIEYLKQLNGSIHLIRGNHDHFMSQKSFDMWLCDMHNRDLHSGKVYTHVRDKGYYAHIKDNGREVVLCHYPILYWENKERGSIHLYGHVHTYRDCSAMAPNSYNVGVDANNYMPVTLDELIKNHSYNPEEISLCQQCFCMTHTLKNGRCGKCNYLKEIKWKSTY